MKQLKTYRNFCSLLCAIFISAILVVTGFSTTISLASVSADLTYEAAPAAAPSTTVSFAIIGDFGNNSANELAVADLVHSWQPEFIITTGDNDWPDGDPAMIDIRVGKYYHDFIYPYTGIYGSDADINRFFPSLGNHDYNSTYGGYTAHYNFFTLPNNERYYDFTWGPVQFFAINSDSHEPDGTSSTSTQGQWLQNKLANSNACWQLIYFHHPPYSSGTHGSTSYMQWPFQSWGADAVIAGHDHAYERIIKNGFPYFVNGTGGVSLYSMVTQDPDSQFFYSANYGAQLVTATENTIDWQFIDVSGTVIDTFYQEGGCAVPSPNKPSNLTATAISFNQINLTWQDNADNEDGFKIERLLDGQNFGQIAIVVANVTTYNDIGLNANTTYYYRVQAYKSTGDSAYSNTSSATTPATPKIHVSDLDGASVKSRTRWNANVTITVVDQNDNKVQGVTVSGAWSNGAKGTSICTTGADGTCIVSKTSLKNSVASVTFTVKGLSKTGYTYDSAKNSDPDGDSTGTMIIIYRPN